jgi:hypothetical protein
MKVRINMKMSELIKELGNAIGEHGDAEIGILCYDDFNGGSFVVDIHGVITKWVKDDNPNRVILS